MRSGGAVGMVVGRLCAKGTSYTGHGEVYRVKVAQGQAKYFHGSFFSLANNAQLCTHFLFQITKTQWKYICESIHLSMYL